VAEAANRGFPDGGKAAHINRALLGRAVRFMAEQGIDQFLDLGSGLPTVQNTHEVAQAVNPSARVAYVDNDPIVLAHGRALLAENDSTIVVTADLLQPAEVMSKLEISGFFDFRRPIGLILNAVIHHVLDEEDPFGVVEQYKELLAPGSYLLLTHFSSSSEEARGLEDVLLRMLGRGQLRSREEITRFFDGLDLVEPGIIHPAAMAPRRAGDLTDGHQRTAVPRRPNRRPARPGHPPRHGQRRHARSGDILSTRRQAVTYRDEQNGCTNSPKPRISPIICS
jgi:SAM-dependent methyltransferase